MAKELKKEESLEVQEVVNTAGAWVIRHQNGILWSLVGIFAIVAAVVLLNRFYVKPTSEMVDNEIAKAVVYFSQGNYDVALNGDDEECVGFEELASNYKFLKPGKLAALYAGICYYNLGEYEQAISFLKKFDADDLTIAPAAKLKLGDAYAQLDETEKAAKVFMKAAKSENELIAPIALKKAGIAYLNLENKKEAKKAFVRIKEKYPTSMEAQDIDKYIAVSE